MKTQENPKLLKPEIVLKQLEKILKERYNVFEELGYYEKITPKILYSVITKLLNDKEYHKNILERFENLIDGKGAYRLGQLITGGENV